MNIYKPSELKAFLLENNKKANKRLSQNFLIDKNIIDKIVKYNASYKSFPVLEIGPGPGALTEQLLNAGFKVHAIELDHEFAELLKKRLTPFFPNLRITEADFLKVDLKTLSQDTATWNVIANLPYHITSKALIKLLIFSKHFTGLTLMVQKEFYDRILALDGKDYGIINILARVCSSSIEGFKVSASCFYPAPRVDSAVLHINLASSISPAKLEEFHEFLKAAFSNRRKKLINNLGQQFSPLSLQQAFDNLEISDNARVESLKPETYFRLFNFLTT